MDEDLKSLSNSVNVLFSHFLNALTSLIDDVIFFDILRNMWSFLSSKYAGHSGQWEQLKLLWTSSALRITKLTKVTSLHYSLSWNFATVAWIQKHIAYKYKSFDNSNSRVSSILFAKWAGQFEWVTPVTGSWNSFAVLLSKYLNQRWSRDPILWWSNFATVSHEFKNPSRIQKLLRL